MSVSNKSSLASILKTYSPSERDKAKSAAINKVRFEMPKAMGLVEVVKKVQESDDVQPIAEFVAYLNEMELNDVEFVRIISEARRVVTALSPKFTTLVEALLALSWTKRSASAVLLFSEFCIDLMVVHSKYIHYGIGKLIQLWIPAESDYDAWKLGTPAVSIRDELQAVHKLLDRILNAIPMTFDVVLESIRTRFPYVKKAPHIVAGYLHNALWLIEYKPIFSEFVLQLLLQKLVILDVNAPRSEIEVSEAVDDYDDKFNKNEEWMTEEPEPLFEMDNCNSELEPMIHPVAHTLDICMEKMFAYFATKNPNLDDLSTEQRAAKEREAMQFLKMLLQIFDNTILTTHNTHHVQFLIFYYCSFKQTMAEAFLISLLAKFKNPNVPSVIRVACVFYMASFLARAKFIPVSMLKDYLKGLCNWAHNYIERCDQYRTNGSVKANLVFFVTCQAIFYIIAFRSRDLTIDKKNLHFLQSLQLSTLVTCNFNPLRVCLPAVATAFAGMTRAYQLAYCHAILERNARRKLATVYANDTATAEETMDTLFPFDPYLLKLSGSRIGVLYLQYQASDGEERVTNDSAASACEHSSTGIRLNRRKRGDSEMLNELEADDFLITDKRQKFIDLAKSQEREAQFTYGLSPGFHI